MTKNPKHLSNEELLASLDDADTQKEESTDIDVDNLDYGHDVLAFINYYNLEIGDKKVPSRIIYKLYRTFSMNPIKKEPFYIFLSQFIDSKDQMGNYRINQNIIHILNIISTKKNKDPRSIKSKIHPNRIKAVKDFMTSNDVKAGPYWVESIVLIDMYRKYSKEYRKTYLHAKQINNILKTLLEYTISENTGCIWYRLNKKSLDFLGEEWYNRLYEESGYVWWKDHPIEEVTIEEKERKKKAIARLNKRLPQEKEKNTQH